MKKGFTLLELIIVIIILGVLATLGLMQYQAMIEKSRGAEARAAISTLRSSCAAIWMQNGNTTACTAANLGLSASATLVQGEMPGTTCWTTNYFRYGIVGTPSLNAVRFQATRCTSTGKTPNTTGTKTLDLEIDFSTGADTWSSVGGY